MSKLSPDTLTHAIDRHFDKRLRDEFMCGSDLADAIAFGLAYAPAPQVKAVNELRTLPPLEVMREIRTMSARVATSVELHHHAPDAIGIVWPIRRIRFTIALLHANRDIRHLAKMLSCEMQYYGASQPVYWFCPDCEKTIFIYSKSAGKRRRIVKTFMITDVLCPVKVARYVLCGVVSESH